MVKFLLILAALVALTACGSDEKPPLEGERIPALSGNSGYVVDRQFAAAPLSQPAAVSNTNWAQPGGTAAHNPAPVAGVNLTEPQQAWSADAPGTFSLAFTPPPLVADGRVFVMSRDAVLSAFELATGAPLWSIELGPEAEEEESLLGAGFAYDQGVVYAVDGVRDLLAVAADSGKVLWRKATAGLLRTAPTLSGGQGVVVTARGRVIAFNRDGSGAWQSDPQGILDAGWFGQPPAAMDQEIVIATAANGRVEARSRLGGNLLWYDEVSRVQTVLSRITLADIQAKPILDRGVVYVVGTAGPLVALRRSDGQRLWQRQLGSKHDMAIAGGLLYVLSDDSLIALGRASGKIRWVANVAGDGWFSPRLVNDAVVLVNQSGEVKSFDLLSGEPHAVTTLAIDELLTAPTFAAGSAIFLSEDGELSVWR